MTGPAALDPVSVGLVGSGAWAAERHGPLHAAAGGPTTLAAVWARDAAKARRLADALGVPAAASFEDLLERCEAVDLAVTPAAQAELAPIAARAGRALALEKPLGATLAHARAIEDAARRAGVPTLVAFTKRYASGTAAFLDDAATLRRSGPLSGGRCLYIHGGLLEDGFVGSDPGWRGGPEGILLDLGAHALDLVDAAAGPISSIRCETSRRDYTAVTCRHDDGALTQLAISGTVRAGDARCELELFSAHGTARLSSADLDHEDAWQRMRAELAAAVRAGAPVTVDAARALTVQRLLAAATASLGTGGWEPVPST